MVLKPISFAAIAVLIAVGAGTGAYLATRDNEARTPGTTGHMVLTELPEPVCADPEDARVADATEEIISHGGIVDQGDADRVNRTPSSEYANSSGGAEGETAPALERGAESDTGPSTEAGDASRISQPSPPPQSSESSDSTEVQGWARVPRPSTSPDTDALPDQVTLATIATAEFGQAIDPEEQPRIVRELVILADSVIGLQVDTPVSSEDAQVEDDVEARVTRDVLVDDEIAIPAGTRVLGSVVLVEHTEKIRGASRFGVRFHTVVLDDIFEVPLVTETIYREGKGRGGESAAKIGGAAVGGAILGAIFGGRQGAAIGGAAGAAGGTAAAMGGAGQPATLPAGSILTVRLSRPTTVTVEY